MRTLAQYKVASAAMERILRDLDEVEVVFPGVGSRMRENMGYALRIALSAVAALEAARD